MKKIIIIALMQPLQLFAQNICNSNYTPPQEYLLLKSQIDREVRVFSISPAVASKADQLFSTLIKAKSPVLISWLKKRNLQNKNETKIIKTWRLYFANQFMLSKYPQKYPQVNLKIEKLFNKINELYKTKAYQKRINKLFQKTKDNQ